MVGMSGRGVVGRGDGGDEWKRGGMEGVMVGVSGRGVMEGVSGRGVEGGVMVGVSGRGVVWKG